MSLQFRASVRGTMSHRNGMFMVDSLSYFSFQQVPMAVCVCVCERERERQRDRERERDRVCVFLSRLLSWSGLHKNDNGVNDDV